MHEAILKINNWGADRDGSRDTSRRAQLPNQCPFDDGSGCQVGFIAQKPPVPATAEAHSSLVSYSQSQVMALPPLFVTMHQRDSSFAWTRIFAHKATAKVANANDNLRMKAFINHPL
jgi:hypothetical protein